MTFVTRKRPRPVVPIISLIDILAILLIFFIVTTTFKERKALLNISLPKSGELTPSMDRSERLTVSVTKEGDVFLEEAKVELEQLSVILQGLKQEQPDLKLELKADQAVELGVLVLVWDGITKAGIKVKDVPARIELEQKAPGASGQ